MSYTSMLSKRIYFTENTVINVLVVQAQRQSVFSMKSFPIFCKWNFKSNENTIMCIMPAWTVTWHYIRASRTCQRSTNMASCFCAMITWPQLIQNEASLYTFMRCERILIAIKYYLKSTNLSCMCVINFNPSNFCACYFIARWLLQQGTEKWVNTSVPTYERLFCAWKTCHFGSFLMITKVKCVVRMAVLLFSFSLVQSSALNAVLATWQPNFTFRHFPILLSDTCHSLSQWLRSLFYKWRHLVFSCNVEELHIVV